MVEVVETPFVVGVDEKPVEMLLVFGGKGNSNGGGIGRILAGSSS